MGEPRQGVGHHCQLSDSRRPRAGAWPADTFLRVGPVEGRSPTFFEDHAMPVALKSTQNLVAGLFVCLLGVGVLVVCWPYPVGSLVAMGPGFVPRCLGIAQIGIGLIILVRAFAVRGEAIALGRLAPAGIIVGAVVAFALSVERFGLVPAIFLVVAIAALASERYRPIETITIAAVVSVGAVLLFITFLSLPISPVILPWTR